MPSISTCPECHGQISLPRGIGGASRVQCPLCDAEYLLADAFRTAPPELIVLQVIGEVSLEGATDERDDLSEFPTFAEPRKESFSFASLEGDAEDAGDASGNTAPAFAGVAIRTKEPAAAAPREATAASLKRPQSESSFGRQLVGVIGGGVLGLVLGYVILLWVGGPQSDFLRVGHKLPAFLVPSEFHPPLDFRPPPSYEQSQDWRVNLPPTLAPIDQAGDAGSPAVYDPYPPSPDESDTESETRQEQPILTRELIESLVPPILPRPVDEQDDRDGRFDQE